MDGYYDTQLLYRLKKSYDDRRNTLTWALIICVIAMIGFGCFVPFNAAIIRGICVGAGWSVIHLMGGM